MNRTNPLIYIAIGVGVVIVAFLFIFAGFLPGKKPPAPDPVTLEFWGFEDETDVWRGIIQKFQEENRHITVNYQKFDATSYENILVNRIAEARGPDIFMLKNSWITKHRDKIVPLPQDVFQYSTLNFKNVFVDEAVDELITPEGEIRGLPLFMDTLALFYSKDIFNAETIAEPPHHVG